MANYINREDVIEKLTGLFKLQAETAKAIVEAIPAADVVERKTGKWITKYPLSTCSVCEQTMILHDFANFCPNCGADMMEES